MAKKPKEKAPRWADTPPPGFMPDGSSMIVPDGEEPKWPEQKILLPDGREVSIEEYEALPLDEDGNDYSFMNEVADDE